MEKVKLPKEVAEAIEWQRGSVSPTNYDIIKYAMTGEGNIDISEFATNNFDELLEALVNGYEVEHSPEDKVREVYEFYKHKDERGNVYDGPTVARIIRDVVIDLGIKIEGVNA